MPEEINISFIYELGNSLVNQWLPNSGWKFTMSKLKKRLGQCNYTKKTIELSVFMLTCPVSGNIPEITNTIEHEIAHALSPGDQHGNLWMEKCLIVGARPERCGMMIIPQEMYNYIALCDCARPHYFVRSIKRSLKCTKCNKHLIIEKIR